MTDTAERRGMRADAARNRRLLLDTAAAAFAEHGMEVSIAQIAARAGIGKGTVFRHFPTKQHLAAAILCDQLGRLAAAGTALLDAADPEAALVEFMTIGVGLQIQDRSFCQAVTTDVRADTEVRAASDHLTEVAEALTDRARRRGVVRADVVGHDIVLLLGAASQAAAPLREVAPDLWRRYLGLIFDGIRPEGAHPLPHPAPTDAQRAAAGRPPADR